jgi:hypothetical protein
MEFAVQIATLLGVLGVIAGLLMTRSIFRKQVNVDIFLAYTERYAKVVSAFPGNAWEKRFNQSCLPPRSEELTLAVLGYMNLCSEEYYLCKNNLLSRYVWRIWEGEIKRTLASPLLRREWQELNVEYQSFHAFQE